MKDIVIIDYGMGNLRSIQYKLEREKIPARISSQADEIATAAMILLPGVGHFARAMENLRRLALIDMLNYKVLEQKTPVMGICLGFQLFAAYSEEGDCPGLGWIDAQVRHFDFSDCKARLPVPHVGWKQLHMNKQSAFFNGIETDQRFYFTHSYHMCCNDPQDVLAKGFYGGEFVAAVECDNIFGTQFHPEKSHYRGFRIVRNFAEHCR